MRLDCYAYSVKKKERPTLESLKAEYAAKGLKVGEVIKTVKGGRYRYARVWDQREDRQRDIYLGPVQPKRLRGILTEKDVRVLRNLLHDRENIGHTSAAEALDKVLKAYDAEE
jgi:hypothetical protein